MKIALTYDDIQLIPEYSEIQSRKDISLDTKLTINFSINMPIIAAPMPTVCGLDMAIELMEFGATGCIHRFMSIEQQADVVGCLLMNRMHSPIVAAVGATGDYLERAVELINSGVDVILIDVAHGHHKNVKEAINKIKPLFKGDIIAGNIATAQAAIDLQDWGADALRVGIGGGSLCTTRLKTGFGVPNVSCLIDIIKVAKVPVIADGGIRTSGDIAKALALGASSVMIGSMIAGTTESPGSLIRKPNGLYKKYEGAASFETKINNGQAVRNIEGESTIIPYKGNVKEVLSDVIDGVKSALSYAGANNLKEFKPKFVQVTNAGHIEGKPHLIS